MNRNRAINLTFTATLACAVLSAATAPLFAYDLGFVPVFFVALMLVSGGAMLALMVWGVS